MSEATTIPLLEITNVSRAFVSGDSEVRALDDVSLTIWSGEFVAIMGQSGSGKTTLMNIVGCLDKATSGTYKVLGQDVADMDADQLAQLRRETFGFVFQRYNLLNNETAAENVEIPAIYAGANLQQRFARAKELLSRLGIGNRLEHRPSQLSGGQQQRVAIARALMNNPPLVLADEPTGALDSKSGADVMELLHELHTEGRTIVLITHDESVANNAERIIRLKDGKISGETILKASIAGQSVANAPIHTGTIGLADSSKEAMRMAFKSLHSNLFRTSLTLLGIIIGVAAVVTMLAVGAGSKQKVLDQITAMGTNLLMVLPGAQGVRPSGDIASLTTDEAEIISSLPNVQAAVPTRSGRMTIRYGDSDAQTVVQGTGAEFLIARDWSLSSGLFFTRKDVQSYAPVVVLGKTVANNLFNDENPINKFVIIKNVPMQVIGVLTAKGASLMGSDQDDIVIVPYTTGFVRLFGRKYLSNITVKVEDVSQVDDTQNTIYDLLLRRHKVEDFNIRNMASLLESATETQNTLTLLLGVVAAISLVVGGIGVMNIMLVSVTERTREIGIRMATGARRKDILLQFNIESVVVCAIGGILGVAFGIIFGLLLEFSGMRVIFTLLPPVLAFTCACATGIVFGYLPARKAAYLDPVVALASE